MPWDIKTIAMLDSNSETQIGHAIEKLLKTNNTLQIVDLSKSEINETIAEGIKSGLKCNIALKKLILNKYIY